MLAEVGPNVFQQLFRSVSPWEMADILETRQIRGRCGAFAGDSRCSPDCHAWFATAIEPIIHSGEDYARYTQTLPVFHDLLEALDAISVVAGRAYREVSAQRAANPWRVDKNLLRTYDATNELRSKLGEAYRKAMYALAKQADASRAKMPVTSYVIHVEAVPGGTMYTADDSRQTGAVEVCFPLAAAETLYEHIVGVDLVKYRPEREDGYALVGHVAAEDLDKLRIKLPTMRAATAQTAINVYNKLRPALQDWVDVR